MSTLLEVQDLHLHYVARSGLRRRTTTTLRALDGVDLTVQRGSALGIVGESGCGKSTLARAVVGLATPTSGTIRLDGRALGARRDGPTVRAVQMVFQDPGSSLNPALSVGAMLTELLEAHGLGGPAGTAARCAELMELVNLPARTLGARPHELSGGQRQRVAIARALAVEPELLIADEAVAALDVSVQATVLNLLADLRRDLGITLVMISHDLAVIRQVCDQVAVMYLGRVVESATAAQLFSEPRHPYTRALLAAVPRLGSEQVPGSVGLRGEMPSPLDIPSGCRFRGRCPMAEPLCAESDPALAGPDGHLTACHFAA
jgi:oligopeptide/dipeptide ABC transporter ATP-binding protein